MKAEAEQAMSLHGSEWNIIPAFGIAILLFQLVSASPSAAMAPPTITTQPRSQTLIAGGISSLSVAANGTAPLHYQWRFGDTNLPGATSSQLVFTNLQINNAGPYSVVITNAYGAITSAVAVITLHYSLTVTVSGNGTVVRSPSLGTFPPGATVTLTPVPASNHVFTGWSGNVTGTNNPLVITMNSNTVIVAHFAVTTLAISTAGQGTVAVSPQKFAYDGGDLVTLTAIPGRWFGFQRWADGPTTNPRAITIGAINNYTAIFSPTTAVETITFNGRTRIAPFGMPAIIVNGNFFADPTNSPVFEFGQANISIVTAFPNGSIFYTLDGQPPSFNSTYYSDSFVIRRSAILRAIAYDAYFTNSWEADPLQIDIEPLYSVNALVSGGGTISLTPSRAFYRSNDVVTITAAPLPGWEFLQWLGDFSGTNSTHTMPMSRDLCAEAVFGTTLATATAGVGSVLLNPSAPRYPYGTVVRLTAVPGAESYFGAWGNAVSGTNNHLYFTVTEPQQTISAVFGALPEGQSTLTVLINGRGRVTATPRANRFTTSQAVTLTAFADPEQDFLGWTDDGTGTKTNLTIVMNRSKVVTANFTARPWLSLAPCFNAWKESQFSFNLIGDLGAAYQIETSPSGDHWTPLGTITNTFGTTQIFDPSSTARRLYRARVLP